MRRPRFFPASAEERHAGTAGSRRGLLARVALGSAALAATSCAGVQQAEALPGFKKDLTNKRRLKVPDSDYKDGPEGLR